MVNKQAHEVTFWSALHRTTTGPESEEQFPINYATQERQMQLESVDFKMMTHSKPTDTGLKTPENGFEAAESSWSKSDAVGHAVENFSSFVGDDPRGQAMMPPFDCGMVDMEVPAHPRQPPRQQPSCPDRATAALRDHFEANHLASCCSFCQPEVVEVVTAARHRSEQDRRS